MPSREKLSDFTDWCQKHVTSEENGQPTSLRSLPELSRCEETAVEGFLQTSCCVKTDKQNMMRIVRQNVATRLETQAIVGDLPELQNHAESFAS
jgi:hypothetical protein